MEDMVLVLCADDRFSMPLAICLYSALVNLEYEGAVKIFIIDDGISDKSKTKIRKVLNRVPVKLSLNWIAFDTAKIQNVFVTEEISKATYLRIFIPDLLPENVKKAIYLDCDVIVEANLAELWMTPFKEELAMGVQDYCFPYLSSDKTLVLDENEQGLVYCNAGVLVINIEAWRLKKIPSKIFSIVSNNLYHDQQGINVIINGNWKLLNPKWNVSLSSVNMLPQAESANVLTDPYIIHYTGKYKPWQVVFHKVGLVSFYYNQKPRSRFFYYFKKSNWYSGIFAHFWVAQRQAPFFMFKLFRRIVHLFTFNK